jgi:hypothetical protein
MTRRLTAIFMASAMALAPLSAHAQRGPGAAKQCPNGLTIPINATSTDQGSFVGMLEIRRFAAVNGAPVALGTLTGTLTDENGVMTSVIRNVALPVVLPTTTPGAGDGNAIGPQAICPILNLVLGPLDLNLLGLIVHLDQVVLDITADSEGGLLGALLCAIAGLLNSGDPLSQILNQLVNLLNQLLGLLG